MRLIDANKLRKEIHCSYSDDLNICEKIDSQPTAYDIDKVVEELDEYITKIVGRKSALYKTIMQIVKAGGEDDKSV